jgi:hypothetical protein
LAEAGDGLDCVAGATVRLLKDDQVVVQTTGDNDGDFKFDRLDENSGVYSVEVSACGGTLFLMQIKACRGRWASLIERPRPAR